MKLDKVLKGLRKGNHAECAFNRRIGDNACTQCEIQMEAFDCIERLKMWADLLAGNRCTCTSLDPLIATSKCIPCAYREEMTR